MSKSVISMILMALECFGVGQFIVTELKRMLIAGIINCLNLQLQDARQAKL